MAIMNLREKERNFNLIPAKTLHQSDRGTIMKFLHLSANNRQKVFIYSALEDAPIDKLKTICAFEQTRESAIFFMEEILLFLMVEDCEKKECQSDDEFIESVKRLIQKQLTMEKVTFFNKLFSKFKI